MNLKKIKYTLKEWKKDTKMLAKDWDNFRILDDVNFLFILFSEFFP